MAQVKKIGLLTKYWALNKKNDLKGMILPFCHFDHSVSSVHNLAMSLS